MNKACQNLLNVHPALITLNFGSVCLNKTAILITTRAVPLRAGHHPMDHSIKDRTVLDILFPYQEANSALLITRHAIPGVLRFRV